MSSWSLWGYRIPIPHQWNVINVRNAAAIQMLSSVFPKSLSQAETCFLIGQISRNGRCSDMELMYSHSLWGVSLSLSVSHCACVRTGCYIKQLPQLYSDTAANMDSLQELLRALDRLLSGLNESLVLKLLKKKKKERWCSYYTAVQHPPGQMYFVCPGGWRY